VKRALLLSSLAGALLIAPAGALAGKPAAKHKPAAHAASAKKAPPASTTKERAPSAATSESTSASSDEGDDSSSEKSVTTPAAGGKKVTSKTYTFGAMDVEGKLKTPQLLYFLNRVKLELDMSAPDKRSFMKELQQSADDKNL
jgi:hypothetical protein